MDFFYSSKLRIHFVLKIMNVRHNIKGHTFKIKALQFLFERKKISRWLVTIDLYHFIVSLVRNKKRNFKKQFFKNTSFPCQLRTSAHSETESSFSKIYRFLVSIVLWQIQARILASVQLVHRALNSPITRPVCDTFVLIISTYPRNYI